MTIDDEYIKSRVKIYQTTRSTISLNEIIEHLSSYIYHYPRKVFCIEHETASNFYLYYLERIDNVLLKYSENEVRFITWFTVTLRNSYLNFVKKSKLENNKLDTILSLDATTANEKLTLYDIIPADNKNTENSLSETAEKIFDNIKERFELRDSLIFALHNLELFILCIVEPLRAFFSISLDEAYKIFEKARLCYIKKYNCAIKHQDLLNSINYKIKDCERNNKDTSILKKRREKYIRYLESLRITVPYTFIGKLFSISENAVNKVILKIKHYFKKRYNNKWKN